MENILEVSGLTKEYKRFSLTDVSFTLPEGCIAGFIGANGAGKTTTIHSILGLTHYNSGSIRLFGEEVTKKEKELKDRIGIVMDDSYFYDELTMAEMKSIIAPAYRAWNEKDFKFYMERFRLNPKQVIKTLSKGMKMKFALTLALSHKAELLIMDEPTSGLDPVIRNDFLGIIKEYMEQDGRAVFFSTHITSDLDKIADLLILIDDGRILWEQEKDMLLDTHRKVKGDSHFLDKECENLFLSLEKTEYGFTGLTTKAANLQKKIPSLIIERPTIEEIMLSYVERGNR